MKVTAELLRRKEGCESQIEVFAQEWPEGAVISLKALKRAANLKLDLGWFAGITLKAPAREFYRKASEPSWKVCTEVWASARKVYRKAMAPEWDFRKVCLHPTIWKVYLEACETAWQVYLEAIAPIVWKALQNQERMRRR